MKRIFPIRIVFFVAFECFFIPVLVAQPGYTDTLLNARTRGITDTNPRALTHAATASQGTANLSRDTATSGVGNTSAKRDAAAEEAPNGSTDYSNRPNQKYNSGNWGMMGLLGLLGLLGYSFKPAIKKRSM